MSKVSGPRIEELRRALSHANPSAFLVEPRVIRRVIRERFGFAHLSASIPHAESQIVLADDVRHLVHPDELGLTSFTDLPADCLLVCQPDEGELEHWPMQELLQQVWRRLFHAEIDRELLRRLHTDIHRADVQERIASIGQVEFDEAHFVLRNELRLVDQESRIEAWREFVALYLEMKHFEPDLLTVWFPSVVERPQIDQVLARDINAAEILQRTQLYGATSPDLTPHVVRDEARLINTRRDWSLGIGIVPSDRAYVSQLRRRERANERGNTVAAAVCAIRAAQRATSDDKRDAAQEKARADVRYLVERLRRAISFPEQDTDAWHASLWELATNSVHGFWNSEKRLLFDLQKVCLDHERVTYKVDLVKWVVSRGRRPLRRPLSSLREVMMAKHLASSAARLVYVRLSGIERERLTALLQQAARLAEQQMRERMRPVIQQTLRDVQLIPANIPEQVAFDKLSEDSLDCIVDRGYLTMGYLRDQISKNDLKLPDLTQLHELWRGDHLLRADDRLDVALDGVYRRGEFYLRLLQITSSLFFGTRAGRFATLFLLIPFGGAVVVVEGVKHIVHMFHPKPKAKTTETRDSDSSDVAEGDGSIVDFTTPSGATASKLMEEFLTEIPLAKNASSIAESDSTVDSNPAAGERLSFGQGATESLIVSPVSDSVVIESESSGASSTPQQDFLAATASNDRELNSQSALNTTAQDETLISQSTREERPEAKEEASAAGTSGKDLDTSATREVVAVPPEDAREAIDQIVNSRIETLSSVLLVGFLLMALIHVKPFREWFFAQMFRALKLLRTVVIDLPQTILHLPVVQKLWRNRTFVRIRRVVLTPVLISVIGCRFVPWLLNGVALNWWWVSAITVLSSLALNSRLGRDTQELTAEWVGNTWYKLHARVVMAVIDWVIDFFRMLLNFLERFLYAVDEWLRFHSDESWLSIVVKAVLGVIWSFASFLIRIYVNLLIEPTFHPVKHFPVVTVAHKMILPGLIYLEGSMVDVLSPYLGTALARSVTWFNIFFIPGIFGFAVWELKENWRLYLANRKENLTPVPVGSHGETVARLLRPGFHSGTLPKLFRRLRRLEHQSASFKRFSARRAARGRLEHVETAIRSFVERDLVRLLELCPVWSETGLRCGHIHAASNSFSVDIECSKLGETPVSLLFQEQSSWVVASIHETGWLRFASADQLRSFQNAIEGFYRKGGIDLVREQLETNFIHSHPYDINSEGLAIWPNGMFSYELQVDLTRTGPIRPVPSSEASAAGINSAEREAVVFSESQTHWVDWEALWTIPANSASSRTLPAACSQKSSLPVIPPIR
ncbi:MAG: hypothetical protein DWI00_05000 [Planctomycetota bacterium]|nr:MAG: hypothetical protein DWI00_05000 [Planctomycetota bacterium]